MLACPRTDPRTQGADFASAAVAHVVALAGSDRGTFQNLNESNGAVQRSFTSAMEYISVRGASVVVNLDIMLISS